MIRARREETKDGMVGPPARSTGILSDIKVFCLHRPAIPTKRLEFRSEADRDSYNRRILQRLGIDVAEYTILNVHKIGIEAPVQHVFEEVLQWDGNSTFWPNHVAEVGRVEGCLEQVEIFLFGRRKYPFGSKNGFFGLRFIPLFSLNLIKVQDAPDSSSVDNARFLLFESHGGYPIGNFIFYVRTPIAAEGETESTQMFVVVAFDFYGDKRWSNIRAINRIWESIHDRVTSNIMNRFKQVCEWEFRKVRESYREQGGPRRRAMDPEGADR